MFPEITSKCSYNLGVVLLGYEKKNLVRVHLGMYMERKFFSFLPSRWKQTDRDRIYTSHFPSYLCTRDQKGFIKFFNKNQISLSQHLPPRLKTILKKKPKKAYSKHSPDKLLHFILSAWIHWMVRNKRNTNKIDIIVTLLMVG